jgi:periplasmic mercuric ion binding protein
MKLILLCAIFLFSLFVNANIVKTSIKTSAVCGMCKQTILEGIQKLEGVKSAKLDLTTKVLKISYEDKLVDIATIEAVVSSLGYDANKTVADSSAYAVLPSCCKKGSKCKD